MRSRVSVWVLAVAGSIALALVAWAAATLVRIEQREPAPASIPIRVALTTPIEPPVGLADTELEANWERDRVSLPVELDPDLASRADEATGLPVVRDSRSGRFGSFELHGDEGVDIVVGYDGLRFGGTKTRLDLRRRPDGTFTCECLATTTMDIGPPFSDALRGVRGKVRLSTFDWEPGTTVVVAYELTPTSGGSARSGLVSFVRY